jgi:hypothetical protein
MQTNSRRSFLLLLPVLAVSSQAETRPDFTGLWLLDLSKSSFDRQGPPKRMEQKVEHRDPEMLVDLQHEDAAGNASGGKLRYLTDGREGENAGMGSPLKYTATWDGKTLIVDTRGTWGTNSIRLVDRWSLSPDRNKLTILRHYEGRGGPQDQTLVFARRTQGKPAEK